MNTYAASDYISQLGLDELLETIKNLPPKLKYCGFVVRPIILKSIKENTRIGTTVQEFVGIMYYEKEQIRGCWKFEDKETMQRYLDGDLTEQDLINSGVESIPMV